MVRIFTFLALFYWLINPAFGQDLIVTVKGDSIQGKIIKQDSLAVRFTDITRGSAEWQMQRDQIKSLSVGYFSAKPETGFVPADTIVPIKDALLPGENMEIAFLDSIVVKSQRPQYWRFNVFGGIGYRLARPLISSTLEELSYIKDLKTGGTFGAEVYFLRWKKVGIGARYDLYMSKGAMNASTKDDIRISFTGASVVYHSKLKKEKNELITGFWLGYQLYNNNAVRDSVDTKLRAKTMGWGVSVGLSHRLGKKVAISLTGACFLSTAYKLKQTVNGREEEVELSKDHFKDLSRASLTLGLTFL